MLSVDNRGTRYYQYRYEVIIDGKILKKNPRRAEYSTRCTFTIQDKDILHCKCAIFCCSIFTPVNILYKETQDNIEIPNIKYHIYK